MDPLTQIALSAFFSSLFEYIRERLQKYQSAKPSNPTIETLIADAGQAGGAHTAPTEVPDPPTPSTQAEEVAPASAGRRAEPAVLDQVATDLRPVVLVCSPPAGLLAADVRKLAHGLLHRIHGIDTFAQILKVDDESAERLRRRTNDRAAALQIHKELAGLPLILVYFDQEKEGWAAKAYLSDVFPTTENERDFTFSIARYDLDLEPAAPRPMNTDLPAWQCFGLAGLSDEDRGHLIARTITGFILGALDQYWQLNRVMTNLLGRLIAMTSSEPGSESAAGSSPIPSALITRIEHEARALMRAGYELSGESHPGHVQLVVTGTEGTLGLVLGLDYPVTPPRVMKLNGQAEEVLVDSYTWTPARSLIEVVEALR